MDETQVVTEPDLKTRSEHDQPQIRSLPGVEDKSLPRIYPDKKQRDALEMLAKPRDVRELDNLWKLQEMTSREAWPEPKNQAEWRQQVNDWAQKQDNWLEEIAAYNKKIQEDIVFLARFITGVSVTDEEAKTIDWVAFYDRLFDGNNPVENYLRFLKPMDGASLKDRLPSIKALTGIFGKEVVHELFEPEEAEEKFTRRIDSKRQVV